MSTLTIRKIDGAVKQALRERAAARGISMEEAARRIITEDVMPRRRKHKRLAVDEILALGTRPEKPWDQKPLADEMWDESL